MHTFSTNQIADILHFNDKKKYVLDLVQRPYGETYDILFSVMTLDGLKEPIHANS